VYQCFFVIILVPSHHPLPWLNLFSSTLRCS